MPKLFVVGNWKMNTTLEEAVNLASSIVMNLDALSGIEKVVCPPFVSLETVHSVIKDTSISLGAQNMHHEEKGAFTGEVSPTMLAGLCQYVILGHSERRQHFGEDDPFVNRKVHSALRVGLRPILCVGETLEQREHGKAQEVIRGQIEGGLMGLAGIEKVVLAYEPVWAIGTGVAATPQTAAEVMEGMILPTLTALFGEEAAKEVPLLYGGSVTPDNVVSFVEERCIHGALVGGASLRSDQFVEIARITSTAKKS